ncbi:hypothetical protein AAG570_001710, partial [Ranatra chinensis]
CGHSDLESILSGLQAVSSQVTAPIDELILENNLMPSLPGRAFVPLRVVRLMLRENKLESVSSNWLAGLEEYLLEVFIVEPELRSLPEDCLENFPKLEALTLQAGGVSRIPNLSNLSRLRYVQVQLPALFEVSPVKLRGLDSLEQIHVVGSPFLTKLDAGVLQDMPRLVTANFTECAIKWVHPRALARLPSLKQFSLSRNKITDAGFVGRSVRELPVLAVISLDHNEIDSLKEASFVDIPPLREIYLNDNRIKEIQRGAFHRLPSLRILDLSNNHIRTVHPEFFLQPYDSGLEDLSLTNNRLDHVMYITIILDVLPRLRFLDLSQNRFQEIMFGSMRGHQALERLHLDHNQLKRVVREAFSGMPALRELRLRNNSLSNYLEMPLWNLPALKGLDLSHNDFRRLDRRMLANLPSLRRIDMSRNNLVVVDPATFLATPALEHVNLSHNAIDLVDHQTFLHLANLFELDVGYNRLRGVVAGLPRALEHLHMPRNQIATLPRAPSPDLLLPALRTLDLTGNNLQHLPSEALISMPLLRKLYLGENSLQSLEERSLDGLGRLEVLDLHDNRLVKVGDSSLRDLRRLREVNLRSNRLETLQPELLRENRALHSLDLSHNLLTDTLPSALENNKELKEVRLSHNALVRFPGAVMSLQELEHLDLSHNRIGQLSQPLNGLRSLATLKMSKNKLTALVGGTFRDMGNLSALELDSNQIQFVTPHAVRSMPALTTLKLSKNRLSTLPSAAFSDLPALLKVELQENQLTHLASDSFTGVPNLLMLNLSYNQLTGLDRAGLNGLKSLEVLDLSHNKVSRFATPGLPHLTSLIHLKMDDNRLCQIQGSPFAKMSHLRMLSLRNNKLTSLSETTFDPIRSTMYHLDVEGNPLRCSCGLLWLQAWLRSGQVPGPRCADGSYLSEYRLSRQDCVEPKHFETIPGCDDRPPTPGQTQLLSTLTESKDPLQRPTPEESEYFYEDYVEYEENTTLPYNLTKLVAISTTASPPTSIPPATAATPSTIPPAVLSHFIPGDTPTLYAGGAKPPSRPDEPKEQQKPQGPTFTFFGMPLHTINLGGFWGSGRDGEGRSRFPGAKGRVQQIPGHPNVEKGFLPIVPGGASGGFKPVFSPFDNRTSGQFSKPIKLNYTIWDLPSQPEGGFPQATVSKVDPEEEEAERVSRLTAEGFNSTKGRPPKVDIETTSDDAPFHGLNGIEAAYETTTVPVTTPEILTRPPITFLPTVTFRVSKGEPTTEPYGPGNDFLI